MECDTVLRSLKHTFMLAILLYITTINRTVKTQEKGKTHPAHTDKTNT